MVPMGVLAELDLLHAGWAVDRAARPPTRWLLDDNGGQPGDGRRRDRWRIEIRDPQETSDRLYYSGAPHSDRRAPKPHRSRTRTYRAGRLEISVDRETGCRSAR